MFLQSHILPKYTPLMFVGTLRTTTTTTTAHCSSSYVFIRCYNTFSRCLWWSISSSCLPGVNLKPPLYIFSPHSYRLPYIYNIHISCVYKNVYSRRQQLRYSYKVYLLSSSSSSSTWLLLYVLPISHVCLYRIILYLPRFVETSLFF